MVDPSAFYPPKHSYRLLFDNNIQLPSQDNPEFYEQWYDYIFEEIKDLLLNNDYLKMVNIMRYHRIAHIQNMVDEIYTCGLESTNIDMDEEDTAQPGCYTTTHILWDYLFYNEHIVKSNLFTIADRLILTLFHPLHEFVIHSRTCGMSYSDFNFSKVRNGTAIEVMCTTNIEVIKNYDQNWYDRLSLLATV